MTTPIPAPGEHVLLPFGAGSTIGTVVETRGTSRGTFVIVSVTPEGTDEPVLSLHRAGDVTREVEASDAVVPAVAAG